ncbi:MAG: GGDEF domain-containing protein, partial [Fibrobacterota bacterium]
MNTITLDTVRIQFLRIISKINLISSGLILTLFLLKGRDILPIHPFLILLSTMTLFFIRKNPDNTIIIKLHPAAVALFYAGANYHLLQQHGELLTYPFFLFPLFASFLLGSAGGLLLSLFHVLFPLAISGFDVSVYGESAKLFLSIYCIETAAILLFERVHDYLLRHIRRTASTDTLTGLENTSGFMFNLTAAASRNTPFYLILTDFDYFSRINTNLGYPLCDAILIRG